MEGMACCDGYLPRSQLTRWPSCGDSPAYIWDTDDSPHSPYLWAPSVTLVGAANQPLSKYTRVPAHFYTPDSAGVWRSLPSSRWASHAAYLPHSPPSVHAPPPLRVCWRRLLFLPVLPLKGSWSTRDSARSVIFFHQRCSETLLTFSPNRELSTVPRPRLRKSGGNKLRNELTFAAGSQVRFAKKWNPPRENATVGAGGVFSPS